MSENCKPERRLSHEKAELFRPGQNLECFSLKLKHSRTAEELESAARAARACTLCAPHLPLGPRPVFRVGATARLLIIGQAPGTAVHETGIPWNDPSGERLRGWLGLPPDLFYDTGRVAIIHTGLCYPGRAAGGGDNPPRPECEPLWHPRLLPLLPEIRLTLLVGGYAQAFHLKERRKQNLTETVRAFEEYLPEFLPLPHPSWRTTAWQRRNPWFESLLLPVLRQLVEKRLSGG